MLQMVGAFQRQVAVDDSALDATARLASYAIINGQLAMLATLRETLNLPPAKLVVFLTVATASVQRHVRRTDLSQQERGSGEMTPEDLGMISGRAVAEATGMPRETVRRMLVELVAEGLLVRRSQGRVSVTSPLADSGMTRLLRSLVDEQLRVLERLRQLGVLQVGETFESQLSRH
jgi:DNA-binding transcriptional regulator YhcF (GntR family)